MGFGQKEEKLSKEEKLKDNKRKGETCGDIWEQRKKFQKNGWHAHITP
jgi:hypothetical protein